MRLRIVCCVMKSGLLERYGLSPTPLSIPGVRQIGWQPRLCLRGIEQRSGNRQRTPV
jgi:hypothetical protein